MSEVQIKGTDLQRLKLLAEKLQTEAVEEMRQLEATVFDKETWLDYAREIGTVAPLQNGQILFCDPSPEGIRLAQQLANLIRKKEGFSTVLRPATPQIVKFCLAKQEGRSEMDQKELKKPLERSDTQQLLDNLIGSAFGAGSSDVHIETNESNNTAIIRYRLNGRLEVQNHPSLQWSAEQALKLGTLIKDWEAEESGGSSPDSFDRSYPQDASCTVTTQGKTVKIRYSHQPTSSPTGLSMVMRLLASDGEGRIATFQEQGYDEFEQALLRQAFNFPYGLVLFTGPTGSGKSTSMAAGIQTINSTKKILAYEDPVENKLPNANQVQVNNNIPRQTWKAYAKGALRQDPDVIVYGELRDLEVVEEAIRQAGTGHLVISTLHANMGTAVPQRLNDMGVEWHRIADPSLLRAIVGQRLVRKLCRSCRVPLEIAVNEPWAVDDHQRVLGYFKSIGNVEGSDETQTIYTANRAYPDCPHCEGRGEIGRCPIAEIIIVDQCGRDFIRKGDQYGWLKYLKGQGWKSMMDSAIAKIIRGDICPLSVEESLENPFGMDGNAFSYEEFSESIEVHRATKVSNKHNGNRIALLGMGHV